MKVTSEKAEHSQVTLDVEMEPPELEKYMEIAYRHVVQRTNIPGFRKGKAPRAVLERHLGRGALVQDAIEHLVPEAVQKAIDEQKIEAIARPEIELVSLEPVRFKAKVPLRPTVTLCDYAKIRVPAVPVEVAEEAVDHTVDQLRQQQSVFTPVDREVRYNDIISMNISGCVGEKQLVDEQETPYRVMKDFDLPLPGFAEKLEGAQRGEERQFSLVFPDQHPSVEFRGKECDFKVKVTDIKEQSLPELDDAFAKSLNMTVETVAALKEKVRKDLEARAAAEERARFEDAALEKLVVCATIDYPSVLLENEIEEMFRREEENAKRSGQKLKDRLRAMNKTEEQLREGLRPVAEKRLLRSLALGKLSDEEKITVKDEDMASETEKMAA
ncbi:MAG: trigger factor, partial [Chloroflexi bacterium]|nr:trigger factor [Chloroflexota bacterium]